jgi:hypothetical protein
MAAPCCYDCLSGDVVVKVTDELGFDHWFCAEDWASLQELREKVMTMLTDTARVLEQR